MLEGISYLLILSVTFGIINRDYVFPLGIVHGILFLAYLILSLQASHKRSWPVIVWLLVFLASVVPFAFIAVEMFLRKESAQGNVIGTDVKQAGQMPGT